MLRVVNETGRGIDTRIYIDDEEVSNKFDSLVISVSVETGVEISARPLVFEVDTGQVELVGTKLTFFNETEELLIKHGWTPPQ